jgi:mannose-6-phosphate isomerase-like protein (cupin superfamily)
MTVICRPLLSGIVLVAMASAGISSQTKSQPPGHHTLVRPDSLDWQAVRPGTERAVVAGDPATPGSAFVLRFRYHGNVRVPPHWHPVDEHLTVLSGTFLIGMGERSDETSASQLSTGAYAWIPAKMAHYAWSKGDTVVQVHGIGPFTVNYVNPEDDPNRRK